LCSEKKDCTLFFSTISKARFSMVLKVLVIISWYAKTVTETTEGKTFAAVIKLNFYVVNWGMISTLLQLYPHR
jgi:hypothetical protein